MEERGVMLNRVLAANDLAERFLRIEITGETISSVILVAFICLLSIYIAIRARFANPLKRPWGILFLAEVGVTFFDNLVESIMGRRYRGFGGFIMAIAVYLFMSFAWSLTGLPSPIVYLATPLSLGLITFVLIHANSVRFKGFRYFKRYIDPIPIFLPINLISMWAPLLSLTMRLFGNALAGWTIMTLIYSVLKASGDAVITFVDGSVINAGGFIAPIATPILHAYFDLFSGLIQTTVFLFLTMIFVGNEGPEEEDIEELAKEGGK